jgi:hypothetical protein
MAMTADQLPDDPDVLKAMVLARDVENARLTQIIKELQRHRFGRRAESLCAGSKGGATDCSSRGLQRNPAGGWLWRLSRARRQERRNARLLLGTRASALLRTRRSRPGADR